MLFECTLDMTKKNFEDHLQYQMSFYYSLQQVKAHCSDVFLNIPSAQDRWPCLVSSSSRTTRINARRIRFKLNLFYSSAAATKMKKTKQLKIYINENQYHNFWNETTTTRIVFSGEVWNIKSNPEQPVNKFNLTKQATKSNWHKLK